MTDFPLTELVVLAVWLGSYGLVARWVFRDARRRGHDPLRALALVSVLWPAGPFLWLVVRDGLHLAPRGGGSAWG